MNLKAWGAILPLGFVFLSTGTKTVGGVLQSPSENREAGKARFNVATPTYATVTCTRHVQHTYYRII